MQNVLNNQPHFLHLMRFAEVPKVFVDETSSRILLAALNRPRTGLEICRATGVPVADVFARLKVLEKRGLVSAVSYRTTLDGKEVPVFQSMFTNAYIFIDKGKLKARFQLVSCGQADYSVDAAALL